jgi:DNA-binding response OmpR family regulator
VTPNELVGWPQRAPGLGRTVLVVDDERIVRTIAVRYLSEAGYRVFESETFAEAWYVAERTSLDLVLLDVVMPGLTGPDMAKLIRQQWPTQRVLFMSAHSDQVLADEGLEPWNEYVLVKPFTNLELLAAVETAISRFQQAPRS